MQGVTHNASAWTRAAGILAGTILLALAFGPSLGACWRRSATYTNEDACQHLAFLQSPPRPDPAGYPDRYYRACEPVGYRLLYGALSAFAGPPAASRALIFVLLAVFLAALWAGGRAAAGPAAGWMLCALALSGDIFFGRLCGAFPRAFGLAFMAVEVYGLLAGRPAAVAAATVGLALFYPGLALQAGLTLLLLLALPPGARGAAADWTLRKRAALLAVTASLAAAAVLPTVLALRPFGRTVGLADYAAYSESAPGGRHWGPDRADFSLPFLACARQIMPEAFRNTGAPFAPIPRGPAALDAAGLWAAAGLALFLARGPAGKRLLALVAAAMISYAVARVFSPALFFPHRHVFYPLLLLALLGAGLGGGAALELAGRRLAFVRRLPRAASVAPALAILLALGGRMNPAASLGLRTDAPDALLAFCRTLPEDAFIAAWPNVAAPIPLLAGRPVLVSLETHVTYHRGYMDEMRLRMRDLIDAYFATTPEPLVRLRDTWGVTHLVVYLPHLTGAKPPGYFRPFGRWAQRAQKETDALGFETLRQREPAAVYADDRYLVLDLARLAAPAGAPPAAAP